MESIRSFELKVGMFILLGIVILVFIIFSVGDINLSKVGYHILITFDFASGLGPSAPVRLAGVGVGRIDGIRVVYNEKDKKTYAEVRAWIQEGTRVEKDSVVTINTLGLLGEKYLEILPGTPDSPLLKAGDTIAGKDPVMMEKVTENLVKISDGVADVVDKLRKGEGTIGRLLSKSAVYDDLEATMSNFKDFSANLKDLSVKVNTSTGTIGRFINDDSIYRETEAFVKDLRAKPWKLLSKPRGEE
jgi:phospholipid/cholesterol/gamma-HCH transport system substrate-binding protein